MSDLTKQVKEFNYDIKSALETLWRNINKGQRKQLYKRTEIKELLDRYEVETDEG